ncbi:MAG TPA: hypothetical protein VLH81_09420 [Desulfobacterales bacterium]|nr:hypothetical protein [Desulfobacterales bacterium]
MTSMNRLLHLVTGTLLACVLLASCATTGPRYSANPIGKLAVLGIQISESVDAAKRMRTDQYVKNFLEDIAWPLAIDPTYQQLKEAKAVTLSFNNAQAGGLTYTSAILKDMAFAEDMPGFILVLDRAHRVRGFGRGFIMDGDRQDRVQRELNRLVEDLLLNLDGKETITYAEAGMKSSSIVSLGAKTVLGADDPANFDFQTDLKKAKIEEARQKAGAKAATIPFYKYLGQTMPNYELARDDGSKVKLHDLLPAKVTMLVVTITPENKGMMNQYNGVGMTLQTARDVYDDFALGEAGPGPLNVPNARPDKD